MLPTSLLGGSSSSRGIKLRAIQGFIALAPTRVSAVFIGMGRRRRMCTNRSPQGVIKLRGVGLVEFNTIDFKSREAKRLVGLEVRQGGVKKVDFRDHRSAMVSF
jgi:hypothetical protein